MKLEDIGAAITKRLWMVITLVLIAALVAAIVAQVQSPVYKVEIAVSPLAPINPTTKLPDPTISGAYAVGLMPTIGNYAESYAVAEDVSIWLANSGIEITPEQLLDKVSAVPEANSTTLKITFSDGSPTRVADIANAWGDVLNLQSLDFEGNEYYDSNFKQMLLGGSINFTNRAIPPSKPTQPKPALYVGLGVFVGLVLGLVLVIGIELFDPHFRSPREAEETLQIPVLGILPKEKRGQAEASADMEPRGPRSWEAYSEMRSNLVFSVRETSSKSILTTAATPFPADAEICATLAASIAGIGRRTLLIDCDLRDRAVSVFMGTGERPGLSDALERRDDPRDGIAPSKVSGLDVLPAGKSSQKSTDLLSLPAFRESLREFEDLYDMVIVYAPPLSSSIDAAILATLMDLSLVVVDTRLCTRKAALEAMNGFDHLNVEPYGVVLANVKTRGRKKTQRAEKSAPEPEREPRAVSKEERAGVSLVPGRERPERKPPAAEERPAVDTPPARHETAVEAEDISHADDSEQLGAVTSTSTIEATRAAEVEVSRAHAGADEGLRQVRQSVEENFRRMGEEGTPIPKNWLRALNSEREDVRESATAAITIYYQAYLRRYRISDESIDRITETIVKMMRKEGEFADMSEEEAQLHLRRMLAESGARFSSSPEPDDAPSGDKGNTAVQPARGKADEKEIKRQEKRRFRVEGRGAGRASGREKHEGRGTQGGEQKGVDWE